MDRCREAQVIACIVRCGAADWLETPHEAQRSVGRCGHSDMSFGEATLIPHIAVIVSDPGVDMQPDKLVIKTHPAVMLLLRGYIFSHRIPAVR